MNNAVRAGALTLVVGGLCLAPYNALADQDYGAGVNCDDPQNQLEMTYCEGEALAREDAPQLGVSRCDGARTKP